MKLAPVALVAFLLATSTQSLFGGETVTVGGAAVPIPDGWTQKASDDGLVLTPPDVPPGVACAVTLLGGEPFDGSLKDLLLTEWKAFEKLGRIGEDNGGTIDGAGNPVEIAGRAGRIDNAGKPSIFVWLVLAHAKGRVEKVVYVASTVDEFNKHLPAVTRMINGTRYVPPVPPKPAAAAAAPAPGAQSTAAEPKWDGKPAEPLRGVYFGVVQVKTSARPECWIFLPDGVVYHGFPFGGPAHLDINAQRKWRPGEVGTYRPDGDAVLVSLIDDKEPTRFAQSRGAWEAAVVRSFQDRWSGRRGNTIATWTDQVPTTLRLTRAAPCDGLKLAGTYRLDALDLAYAPKSIPSVRFTADGQFADDRLLHDVDPGTIDQAGHRTPTAMPADGGRGKYSIAGNTIDVTYKDGPSAALTFIVPATELAKPVPDVLFLQDKKLLRVP